jgi:hypothetical protein
MRTTLEEQERSFRVIYEAFFRKPRIFIKDLSPILRLDRHTAGNRVKKAIELGYVSVPQIRRRSYANLKEYVYFLNCENPVKQFSTSCQLENIVYQASLIGSTNLWVVSDTELDCDCDIFTHGLRSDYHVSYAPNHSWETAIQKMRKKVDGFNPGDYTPEGIIKTHWDETAIWDSEYETLFNEFNYNLRKPITPIIRKNLISWGKLEKWLNDLPKYCTIATFYYPDTIKGYDPYLFMFETDYEDFVINLFSELPSSCLFFNVSNMLFLLTYMKREYLRVVDFEVDIRSLQIPMLTADMLRRGIIQSEFHTLVECFWNRDP